MRDSTPRMLSAAAEVLKALGPSRPDFAQSQFRALRTARTGGRAGPVRAGGRHRAGRSGLAPSDRQPRVHGQGGWRHRGRAERSRHRQRPSGPAAAPAKALLVAYRAEAEQVRAVIGLADQLEQMQAARNALGGKRRRAWRRTRRPRTRRDRAAGGVLASPWLPLVLHRRHVAGARGRGVWLQRELANLRRVGRPAGADRTSATSRRSCGCSTNCRALPTAT